MVSVEVVSNLDGSAVFRAVAKEGGENGEILATETLEVPFSARKKFGDKFLEDDMKRSVKYHIAETVRKLL